jgi:hypothetical protein
VLYDAINGAGLTAGGSFVKAIVLQVSTGKVGIIDIRLPSTGA